MIKTNLHKKIFTKNKDNLNNGYLIPIYNINDNFFELDKVPQQVYLTVISPNEIKGPHLHFIRTGCFICIKGNARFVLKYKNEYVEFYSGEEYGYLSVEVPTGIPAAIQNLDNDDTFILNMPSPAWTQDMNDEHTADFSDFNFESFKPKKS